MFVRIVDRYIESNKFPFDRNGDYRFDSGRNLCFNPAGNVYFRDRNISIIYQTHNSLRYIGMIQTHIIDISGEWIRIKIDFYTIPLPNLRSAFPRTVR